MKCGDRGHTTTAGMPCQQTIGATATGCVWHTRSAEGRRLLAQFTNGDPTKRKPLPGRVLAMPPKGDGA